MLCREIIDVIEGTYPKEAALAWDNVGLFVGRTEKVVKRIYVALDANDEIIEAAIMGSEAFFEPWTKQAPRSRFPPLICHISIKIPPVHSNHAILCRGALICSFFRRPLCGQGL